MRDAPEWFRELELAKRGADIVGLIEKWERQKKRGKRLSYEQRLVLRRADEIRRLSPYTVESVIDLMRLQDYKAGESRDTFARMFGDDTKDIFSSLDYFIQVDEEILPAILGGAVKADSSEEQLVDHSGFVASDPYVWEEIKGIFNILNKAIHLEDYVYITTDFNPDDIPRTVESLVLDELKYLADEPLERSIFLRAFSKYAPKHDVLAHLNYYNRLRKSLGDAKFPRRFRTDVLTAVTTTFATMPEAADPSRSLNRLSFIFRNGQFRNFSGLVDLMTYDVPGYYLVGKIGEGGSRKVYLAFKVVRDRVSSVPVKIKIFKEESEGRVNKKIAAQRDRRERDTLDVSFVESDALSGLHHPNLIRYFNNGVCIFRKSPGNAFNSTRLATALVCNRDDRDEFDESHDRPFIVSEYIRGSSVEDRLNKTGDVDISLVLRNVAAGLSYLHNQGYLHRDLKLGNVLVSHPSDHLSSPRVVIDDLETIVRIDDVGTDARRVTIGSDRYAAPELMHGARATVQSDIYAFGACLLYMLEREVDSSIENMNCLDEKEYKDRLEIILADLHQRQDSRGLKKRAKIFDFDNPWERLPYDFQSFIRNYKNNNIGNLTNLDLYEYVLRKCLAYRPEDRPARVGDIVNVIKGISS